MKKITYSCDLCKETKDIDNLIGYMIVSVNPGRGTEKTIKLNDLGEVVENSNNHICFDCAEKIEGIKKRKAT